MMSDLRRRPKPPLPHREPNRLGKALERRERVHGDLNDGTEGTKCGIVESDQRIRNEPGRDHAHEINRASKDKPRQGRHCELLLAVEERVGPVGVLDEVELRCDSVTH